MLKNFLKNNPIHKKIVPSLDCFFLIRPTSFFVAWPLLFIGMYIPMLLEKNIMLFTSYLSISSILLFIGYSMMIASISMINETTKTNKYAILDEKLSNKMIFKTSYVLYALSMILFLFLNIKIFIASVLVFLVSNCLFYCKTYKKHWYPVFWLFAIFILCFLFLSIGSVYQTSISNHVIRIFDYNLIILFLPYVLSFIGILIIQDIIYSKNNQNDKTFSSVLGKRISSFVSFALVFLALLISLNTLDPLASTTVAVYITFFLYVLIRAENKDFIRAVRYPVGIQNFFIMTIYPYLFIPSIILFYVSKYYYWHRFDIHYPTFLVDND